MDENLVKLCSDEIAHAKYKQLYGEKPEEKTKAVEWEAKRLAFFLAWDACKKVMKERVEEEIQAFFAEVDSENVLYDDNKGKYVSQRWIDEFRV